MADKNILPVIGRALAERKASFAKGFLIMGGFYGLLLMALSYIKAPVVFYDLALGLMFSILAGIYFAVKDYAGCIHASHKGGVMGSLGSTLGPFCSACPACVPEAYMAMSAAFFVIPKGLMFQIGPYVLLIQIMAFTLMLGSIRVAALHGGIHGKH